MVDDEEMDESNENLDVKDIKYTKKLKENTSPNYKKKVFCKEWLIDPEFRDWIREYEGDKYKVICTVCQMVLVAGRSDLQRHAAGKKHQTNLSLVLKPRKSLNEIVEELDIVEDLPSPPEESGNNFGKFLHFTKFLLENLLLIVILPV